ncbi:hypothetical protein M0Q97_05350 [Candidatus Dojkabacteria bacterium]|jgi:hypothetical protein|nr:hypothetical protein [Candidatus Dojkabacteria bacterium]
MITNFKIFEASFENDIKKEAKKIIKNYDPIISKYEDDNGYLSVLLKDKNSSFESWIDISIEDYEISADWNQISYYRDNSNDMIKQKVENNSDVFDMSLSVAEEKLLEDNMIYYEDDKYYYHKDFWYEKDGYKERGIDYDAAKKIRKYNI